MAKLPCGTRVLDPVDPRHVGVIVAGNWDTTVRVRWTGTGWYSDVSADSLVRAPADDACPYCGGLGDMVQANGERLICEPCDGWGYAQ